MIDGQKFNEELFTVLQRGVDNQLKNEHNFEYSETLKKVIFTGSATQCKVPFEDFGSLSISQNFPQKKMCFTVIQPYFFDRAPYSNLIHCWSPYQGSQNDDIQLLLSYYLT